MDFDLIRAVGCGVAECWKTGCSHGGQRSAGVVIGCHCEDLRDGIRGEGAKGHKAVDGALPLQDGIVQVQFVGERCLVWTRADPLDETLGYGEFTSPKLRQQMRNCVGTEFSEGDIEFRRGAAAVNAVFEIERRFEPLVEGKAINCGTGVPAGEENPAGSQEKKSEQDGDPESEAGFCFVDFWDVWSLCGATL